MNFFNAPEYFEDCGIRFWTSGKNVSKGWTNICCPYCDDRSNHLGVSPDGQYFSCWKCNHFGGIIELVQTIEKTDFKLALEVINRYKKEGISFDLKEEKEIKNVLYNGPVLPKEAKPLTQKHKDYLLSRNFDPELIEKKYNILGTGPIGDYKHRLIIPIFIGSSIVNFTARDITGQALKKYKECSRQKAIIQKEFLFYGLNKLYKETALIVEGVFDVWRIGNGALGVLGSSFSDQSIVKRILLLIEKGIKNVFIMFDGEEQAQKQSEKIANKMAPIFHTEILYLKEGDPDSSLSENDVIHLRKQINL